MRSTTGDDLKVRELHFKRYRSSPHACTVAMVPDLVDQRTKLGSHVVKARQISRERVLRSNRFADAVRENWTMINSWVVPVEMPSRLPEMLQQEGFRPLPLDRAR